jgi:pimeloyl-ACP methyl ester carboxylesterase
MKMMRRILMALFIGCAYSHGWLISAEELKGNSDLSPAGRYIHLKTHRLYIHCMGDTQPAVVIDTGLGGSSLEWFQVQQALAKRLRVCTYDRAGYGWSDPGPSPRITSRIVEELHKLLDKAQVPPPYVLIGHSFGGFTARYFATLYPAQVVGVVLVDSSHPDQSRRMSVLAIHAKAKRSARDRIDIASLTQRADLPEEIRLAFYLNSRRKALFAQMDEIKNFALSAAEVSAAGPFPNVPLVVLSHGRHIWPAGPHGDRMEAIWRELQQSLSGLAPRSRHIIAERSGHNIHLDQPELVVGAVEAIVRRLAEPRVSLQKPP